MKWKRRACHRKNAWRRRRRRRIRRRRRRRPSWKR